MEHQDHGESVQFADVPLIRDDVHLGVPHRRQAGGGATAPRPDREYRRVAPSAPRQGRHPEVARHQPGAGGTATDRHAPLRERMSGLPGSCLLLMVRILVVPLVITGYVGLTVLLFLPLLGLRWMFSRRSTPAVVRWDGDAPLYSGVENLWDAARRRA